MFHICIVRRAYAALLIATALAPLALAESPLFPSQRIWGEAPHSAFTDLLRHEGIFYCTFREGTGHVPGEDGADGTIRLIASTDGITWTSVGLLAYEGIDLRDPKISVTPENKIMVLMGGSHYDGKILGDRTPAVCFYDPKTDSFGDITFVVFEAPLTTKTEWLWRVTWHEGTGYGLVYQAGDGEWGLHLVSTTDGIHYRLRKTFDLTGRPNEGTLQFRDDGSVVAIVRTEDKARDHRGWLGTSAAPYTDWTWTDMDTRLGGPDFEILAGGTIALSTRSYTSPTRTVVGTVDASGHFEEKAQFPSGGDTSYPGLVVYEDELWISYYASHEDKTAIYLARVPLSLFE